MRFFLELPTFSASDSAASIPGSKQYEALETMKTSRIITTMAAALVMFTGSATFAQSAEPSAAVAGMYRSVEADNIKTVAGSGAQSIAVQNTQQSSLLARLQDNSINHTMRVNALAEKSLGQTMVTSATEGSKAVETVQQAGDAKNVAQALAILATMLQSTGGAP